MSRRLLAIAYHVPPIQGSSGVHRTLAFARYLRDFDWATTILTVTPRAYANVRPENDSLIPTYVDVVRAPAFDTVRHLSLRGRYFRWMALPDRWQSWIPGGIVAGLATIRRQKPAAILSTFPIASAHAIGLALARITGLPWIADFRDPMDQITYPKDPTVRRAYRWIEERAFRHAARILVTTPGTANYYRERYGDVMAAKIRVIPNGFDPEAFPADFTSAGGATASSGQSPADPGTQWHPLPHGAGPGAVPAGSVPPPGNRQPGLRQPENHFPGKRPREPLPSISCAS